MSNEALHDDKTPSFIWLAAIATLYKAVQPSTARNTVEVAVDVDDIVIGISQAITEAAGEAVAVKRDWFSLATVGAWDRSKWEYLTAGAGWVLIATTTATDLVCAIAMEDANETEFWEVLVLPYPLPYSTLT